MDLLSDKLECIFAASPDAQCYGNHRLVLGRQPDMNLTNFVVPYDLGDLVEAKYVSGDVLIYTNMHVVADGVLRTLKNFIGHRGVVVINAGGVEEDRAYACLVHPHGVVCEGIVLPRELVSIVRDVGAKIRGKMR